MPKLPSTNRPRVHKPSPLQPYVDSGAKPVWMLLGHLLEKLPHIILAIGTVVGAWYAQPHVKGYLQQRFAHNSTLTSTRTSSTNDVTMQPSGKNATVISKADGTP